MFRHDVFTLINLYFFVDLQKKIDLPQNGCSCTQNGAVNKWICHKNWIFFSPEF